MSNDHDWQRDREICEAFIREPWRLGDAADLAENLPPRMIAALDRIEELEQENRGLLLRAMMAERENERLREERLDSHAVYQWLKQEHGSDVAEAFEERFSKVEVTR